MRQCRHIACGLWSSHSQVTVCHVCDTAAVHMARGCTRRTAARIIPCTEGPSTHRGYECTRLALCLCGNCVLKFRGAGNPSATPLAPPAPPPLTSPLPPYAPRAHPLTLSFALGSASAPRRVSTTGRWPSRDAQMMQPAPSQCFLTHCVQLGHARRGTGTQFSPLPVCTCT